MFPRLKKEHVEEEFRKWGGVSRILFDFSSKPEKLAQIHDSIYSSDPFTLFGQPGMRVDHSNVSGLHFHPLPGQKVHPNSTFLRDFLFRYPAYSWATTWLQDQVWEGLQKGQGEKSILDFLNNRNNVFAARAYAFELHVFQMLENAGISCRLRRLTEDSVQELPSVRLTPLRHSTFVNLDDLSPESIGFRNAGDVLHIGAFRGVIVANLILVF